MNLNLERLETLASDRKRWPTMAEIGELRHGTLALIQKVRELENEIKTINGE